MYIFQLMHCRIEFLAITEFIEYEIIKMEFNENEKGQFKYDEISDKTRWKQFILLIIHPVFYPAASLSSMH